MNIFSKLAVSALAFSVASVASAASVSGSTDFRVTLPEILVLYHWDDVVLNLSGGNIAQNDSIPTRIGTAAIGDATVEINDPAINATADALSTSMKVTLKDAWAVRNLSNTTGVNLVLTNPNPTLTSTVDKQSFLTTTGAVLKSDSAKINGAKEAATLNILSGWTPVTGDIIFDLNLSKADSSGEYNTRGAAGTTGAGPVGSQSTDSFLLTLNGQ